jgi:hypothetical protein
VPSLDWIDEFNGITANISIREISDEDVQQYL